MSGRRSRPISIAAFLLAAALACFSAPAEGQLVVGSVVEEESAAPLEGAFVVLVDADETTAAGVLSGADGGFALRVPAPGTYRLGVERIGFRTYRSEPFTIGEGETLRRDLAVPTQAISLEGITVQGDARCDLGGEGGRVAEVWEEARKALSVTAWADSSGIYRFAVTNFSRRLDSEGRRVVSEERARKTSWGLTPYESRPAEDLAREGYVRFEEGDVVYFAPDAKVLLSDAFLRTHCFQLVREEDRLGLAFSPQGSSDVQRIDGVLWLDPETAYLESLHYRYPGLDRRLGLSGERPTTVPWSMDDALDRLGGEVHFERLPSGAWIVREWVIRMPVVARVRDGGGRDLRRVVAALHEQGGRVEEARAAEGRLTFESSNLGVVVGEVFDSTAAEPLVEAEVFLWGTGYGTRTDSLGTFTLPEVRAGEYTVGFDHPRLRELGISPPERAVTVEGGRATPVRLAVPGQGSLHVARYRGAVRACREEWGGELPEEDLSVLMGRVRTASGGPGVAEAEVVVTAHRYSDVRESGGDVQFHRETFEATVTSGADGRFRLCSVPSGWSVTVAGRHGLRVVPSRELGSLDPLEIREVELVLESRRR